MDHTCPLVFRIYLPCKNGVDSGGGGGGNARVFRTQAGIVLHCFGMYQEFCGLGIRIGDMGVNAQGL